MVWEIIRHPHTKTDDHNERR